MDLARFDGHLDPHKRSATIEILDRAECVLGQGRLATDPAEYRDMLALGRRHPERVWAVEGCNGIGKHLAQRLVADGETVLDVPAKLSARARVFSTDQAARPTPSMLIPSRSWPCGPPAWHRYGRMIIWWCCGCWPTVATSWA